MTQINRYDYVNDNSFDSDAYTVQQMSPTTQEFLFKFIFVEAKTIFALVNLMSKKDLLFCFMLFSM